MSSEIVPALEEEGSDDSYTGEDSNAFPCRQPMGLGYPEDIRPFDLLGFTSGTKYTHVSQLIGGDYHTKNFLASENGHKYITELDPTPDTMGNTIGKMKDPSVLLLRGCDQLFLQSDFPFARFRTLTSLEISDCDYLTTLPPNAISEMTQLENLTLSHLPIEQLPDDLFSNITNLRSLIIRGCSNLHSIPKLHQLTALQFVELSHLLIETLPEDFFPAHEHIRQISLRGCSKLHALTFTQPFYFLEVLDLSHCTALQKVEYHYCVGLRLLDVSYTALNLFLKYYATMPTNLNSLYFRDAKVSALRFLWLSSNLKVVDLSGAQNVKDADQLEKNKSLEALDLSRTGIESIDFISDMHHLHYLILRECTRLVRLPAMEKLTELEVLDVSGCEILADLPEDMSNLINLKGLHLSGCSCLKELREGLFEQMSCLENLDLSKTNITHLPSFANLTSLRSLNISHTSVEQVPDLSYLINLKELCFVDCHKLKGVPANLETRDLAPPGSGEIDFIGSIPKPSEFHLVSTFTSSEPSSFDRFKDQFSVLCDFISNIQKSIISPSSNTFIAPNITSQVCKYHLGSVGADLKYILENIDLLESSLNRRSSEELVDEIMSVSTILSPNDFPLDSTNLNQLLRTIVKLKLLVPPKQGDALARYTGSRRGKSYLSRTTYKEADVVGIDENTEEMQELQRSYESLTERERKCLLYFAGFPRHSMMKMSILIQLWHGEGFIDPQHKENIALSNVNSTGEPNTVEEIGRQVCMVLKEKRFIQIVSNTCEMKYSVCSFVMVCANAERFFDFDRKNCQLTPHLTGSQRACLLKSRGNFPSSCKLWGNYVNSAKKLERFQTVRTLFNVNETFISIRVEWFSKMKNLCVLHLGRWDHYIQRPIEVVDLKFLEELKNMKQLRLLSLEGFSTITKLPDSVCKVTNLKILSLKDCGYLEELPDSIGSLENLTHLDLTDCHVLSKLPKGIRFLSKLEVLKGFVISYQVGGRQHIKACTLEELFKLEKLRKLSLIVNTDKFPNSTDLQVFKQMKNLCNLKITWEKNYNGDPAPQDIDAGQEALRWYSRWKQLKCWEVQTRQNEAEEQLRRNHLDNLKKLVLCCFPFDTAPNWLHPSELPKLEKLYILGGKLKTLAGDTNQHSWNVKVLCFSHLHNMNMDWEVLRCNFPRMTHFFARGGVWTAQGNDILSKYPCNYAGVWTAEGVEYDSYWK